MKNKTKKYIPNKFIKHIANDEKKMTHKILYQHKNISKLLSRILIKHNKDNLIALRPKQADVNTKIINYINGIENILPMSILKDKFKTFFTLDYMNYVALDTNKRSSEISANRLTYQNKPIILEGYLAITITCGNPSEECTFNSYMYDSFKILTNINSNKQDTLDTQDKFFPDTLPDNFANNSTSKSLKINEIINQAYTIMKYISIILAHHIKPHTIKGKNTFEVIKVQLMLYDDLSVILDKCIIKKQWQILSFEDNKILDWLNKIYIKNIIHHQSYKQLKLDSIKLPHLYTYELYKKQHQQRDLVSIYAKNLQRSDFNNKFVIISSEYITKNTFTFNQFMIDNFKRYGLEFQDFYSAIGTKPAIIFFSLEENIENDIVAQHYNTLAYCANTLASLQNINNKSTLFYLFKKLYPVEYKNFMAESFDLRRDTQYKPGKIYIVRPVRAIDPKTKKKLIVAHSGKDIMYVNNAKSLEIAKKLLTRYDTVLISDYIRNPLLFKGRKFHIRIFYIIVYSHSVLRTYLFKDSYFMTAAKPFILDKFDDKNIHDSHFDSTDDFYPYNTNLTTANTGREINPVIRNKLWQDIRDLMAKMSSLLIYGDSRVKLYENHKNGFKIEGVDIMVLDNMQPVLIECNAKPGFKVKSALRAQKMHDQLHLDLLQFVNEVAIEPIFGFKSSQSDREHEQYTPLFTKRMD